MIRALAYKGKNWLECVPMVKLVVNSAVAEATWANADVEMQELVCRATGAHASFHIRELHGFKLVFRGPQAAARLVTPVSCR